MDAHTKCDAHAFQNEFIKNCHECQCILYIIVIGEKGLIMYDKYILDSGTCGDITPVPFEENSILSLVDR